MFRALLLVAALAGPVDVDDDGVPDVSDNCPHVENPGQRDADGDGWGDACDVCPEVPDPEQLDADGDAWGDACASERGDVM